MVFVSQAIESLVDDIENVPLLLGIEVWRWNLLFVELVTRLLR